MNERIRELAEQAGIKLAKGDNEDQKFYWFSHLSQLEGFAELVVRECIGIAQDRAAFDWAPPNDVNHIINEIKEHFGVEE
jgi:hypothetical protein